MTTLVRALGYTNSLQELVWTGGNNVNVTAYLWGGGGGGGGNDSHAGGTGSGGGYAKKSFVINNGDSLKVGVGGAGGAGAGGRGAPGGSPGASYSNVGGFSSLDLLSNPINLRVTNGAYCGFLNQYGVWNYTAGATYFDQSTVVNFPVTGAYTFTGSCDNYASIYLDGNGILDIPGFGSSYSITIQVTAGNHSVRLYGVNTGGPGSIGLTISGGASYGGGIGGNSGTSGSSGAGGGGGGASVILLNNSVISVAGGGGGGGGGGNVGVSNGQDAPGPSGQASTDITSGMSGDNKGGADGGGGGAGGGGYGAGNGGSVVGGDQGGNAGYYGGNFGDIVQNPTGRSSGGTGAPYWNGAGAGGIATSGGTPGQAILEFTIGGIYVNDSSGWHMANKTYVKANDVWNPVAVTWIKNNGVWSPVTGSYAPVFNTVSGSWGAAPRPF